MRLFKINNETHKTAQKRIELERKRLDTKILVAAKISGKIETKWPEFVVL